MAKDDGKALINQDSGYISADATPEGVRKQFEKVKVGKRHHWFGMLKSKRTDTPLPSSEPVTPQRQRKFNFMGFIGKSKSTDHVQTLPKSARSLKQYLTIQKSSLVSLTAVDSVHFEPTVRHPQFEYFQSQRKLRESEEQDKLTQTAYQILTKDAKVEAVLKALAYRNCDVSYLIGIGAYGIVMAGLYDGQKVAVKFMMSSFLNPNLWVMNGTDYIPFEAHVLSKLSHPSITKFIDAFTTGRFTVLITELHGTQWNYGNPKIQHLPLPQLQQYKRKYNGDCVPVEEKYSEEEEAVFKRRSSMDLFECIEVHQRLPAKSAMKILKQLADVEQYLLSVGIVHRDIKDENIVIDENYTIKLVDFGSCALLPPKYDKSKWFDMFHGTVLYAPPELLGSKAHYRYQGPEAQIWSMGVLLYVMLYGDNPFLSQDAILEYYHSKQPLKIPPRPQISQKIQKILASLLHREASHRMTVKQLMHSIQEYERTE